MEQQIPVLLDMEQHLNDDQDGRYREQLTQKLDDLGQHVQGAMNAGLGPDDYRKAEALQQAVTAAKNVIQTIAK